MEEPQSFSDAPHFKSSKHKKEWLSSRTAWRRIVQSYSLPPQDFEAQYKTSLSHSFDWGAWLVSKGSPLGIDIERIQERKNLSRIVARQFGQRTHSAPAWDTHLCYRLWTFSEAYFKAMQTMPSLGDINPRLERQFKSQKTEVVTPEYRLYFNVHDRGQYQICSWLPLEVVNFKKILNLIL